MIRKTLDISTIDYKARSSKRTRIYFPCEIKDSIADCALSALAANGLDAADVKEIKAYLVPHISADHLSAGLVVNIITKGGAHITSKIIIDTHKEQLEKLLAGYLVEGGAGLSKEYADLHTKQFFKYRRAKREIEAKERAARLDYMTNLLRQGYTPEQVIITMQERDNNHR